MISKLPPNCATNQGKTINNINININHLTIGHKILAQDYDLNKNNDVNIQLNENNFNNNNNNLLNKNSNSKGKNKKLAEMEAAKQALEEEK